MEPEIFNFYFNTRIQFGIGSRHRLQGILEKNNWRGIGIVVDHNLMANPLIRELLKSIQANTENSVIIQCEVSEPTYDTLEVARTQIMDQGLQAIVGIGGGSALDMAKAMAVLANNKKPAIHYRGFDRMTEPVLPIVAIPTTAGTGSEITPNASFIDAKEKRKMGINGEAVRPSYGILDPELTISCPARPTVSAGVDSIVHAVEAYVARKTNPMARLFAKEGFGRVFNSLPKVVQNPDNVQLRAEVQYGAFLSAIALMNSGTGPAAAMSYPLGVHFKFPHGLGGAFFLPYVAEHNIKCGYHDYGDLYEALEGSNATLTRQQKAESFYHKMVDTWQALEVPTNLADTGFQESFAENFIAETMQLKPALDQNPVPFYEDEIRYLLNKLNDRN